MEKEIVSKIGERVESIDDLLKYSRAVKMLQPNKEVGRFWHSEAFYKFLGGAIGSVVAAVALIASGFISFTSELIESSLSGLELAEKNRAAIQEQLESLTEKNVSLETREKALAQANSDAAEELGKAKGEIRSIRYQYLAREAELSELERQIVSAKQLASKERIAGSVIATCDAGLISAWYRRVSSVRSADAAIFNPLGLSLTLFFVQDGELFFVFRQIGNGRPSQVRTGGGTWRVLQDSVILTAKENDISLFRVSFERTKFEEFSERRVDPRQPNRPTLRDADGKLYFSSRCRAW